MVTDGKRSLSFLFRVALFIQIVVQSFGYKPVIIIHGILDSASDLENMQDFIERTHPGTKVHAIDMFDYYNSFQPLWSQVAAIRNVTDPIMKAAKDGVHVIGYSQGGLIARGLIQSQDHHNVDTFIALSSPLSGQYGDTYVFNWLFPKYLKEELYKLFYTAWGQQWSIGNYWKDPHELNKYKKYSTYLAQLNNETTMGLNMFQDSWKDNFSKLSQLVLIGGPDDKVISPWQSAHFGFYDKNEEVVPMEEMEIFKNDVFGLKTLKKRQAIKIHTVAGVKHIHWHKTFRVFKCCIEPYLR